MTSTQRGKPQRIRNSGVIVDGNGGNNSGSNNGGRMSVGPAPFLMKTHQMVEEAGTDDVISWGENGASFVVWKPVEFARDLLPVHFKHNNFSSFVRQLNTYGFRKVVADRWEFANDNFKRGEGSLLCQIRRRKAPPNPSSANKSNKNTTDPTSTSTSLDAVHSSSSTSSPPPAPPPPPAPAPAAPASQEFVELSNENEKLKKDNEVLSNELTQAKQQCERLISFLSKYVNTNDIHANFLMKEAALAGVEIERGETKKMETEAEAKATAVVAKEGQNAACLKLFGVLLKEFEGEKNVASGAHKRGRCEEGNGVGRPAKVCFGGAPWMRMTSPVRESSKVCN